MQNDKLASDIAAHAKRLNAKFGFNWVAFAQLSAAQQAQARAFYARCAAWDVKDFGRATAKTEVENCAFEISVKTKRVLKTSFLDCVVAQLD